LFCLPRTLKGKEKNNTKDYRFVSRVGPKGVVSRWEFETDICQSLQTLPPSMREESWANYGVIEVGSFDA